MTKMKRFTGAALAALLLFLAPVSVYALPDTEEGLDQQINDDSNAISNARDEKEKLKDNLDAAQAMKESLEQAKDELTGHVVELDTQMSQVTEKLYEVETLLSEKEEELKQTQQDLEEAKKNVEEQYEDMKLRIQFMYEHGSVSFLQILLSAGSFSDMLNKAEYIEQVSAYDRTMLDEFEKTKKKVESLEKDLETQQQVLAQAKEEVKKQQDEMAGLIKDKQDEIEGYETDIANKEEAIAEYEQMIKEQDDTIKALEASVAAAKAKKAQMNVSGNSAGEQAEYNGGTFCWPAPSYTRISDDYGYRIHPILKVQQFHNGVDMAAPSGSAILAAYDGTVVAASYNASMGNYIMIDHGSGLYTIYMHASALYVSSGQSVKKGAQIGAVGSTGRSTGPHLHFSVRLNGSYVSPWNYL